MAVNETEKDNINMISKDDSANKPAKEKETLSSKHSGGFIKSKKKLLIIIGAIILCLAGGIAAYIVMTGPVIKDAPEKIHSTEDGTIRLKTNPAVIVDGRKLTNIEFFSLNKDRDMKICIKLSEKDGEYLYESPIIEEGKVLISDYIDFSKYRENKEKLAPGCHTDVFAELYVYDKDGNPTNQTNCNITLLSKRK